MLLFHFISFSIYPLNFYCLFSYSPTFCSRFVVHKKRCDFFLTRHSDCQSFRQSVSHFVIQSQQQSHSIRHSYVCKYLRILKWFAFFVVYHQRRHSRSSHQHRDKEPVLRSGYNSCSSLQPFGVLILHQRRHCHSDELAGFCFSANSIFYEALPRRQPLSLTLNYYLLPPGQGFIPKSFSGWKLNKRWHFLLVHHWL